MFHRGFVAGLCCVALCSQGVVAIASGITVPPEESSIAATVQAEARRLAEEARAASELQDAKNAVVKAETILTEARKNEIKAQGELDIAKAKCEENSLTVQKNQAMVKIKEAELARAEDAWNIAVLAEKDFQGRVDNALAEAKSAAANAKEIQAREMVSAEVEIIDEARIDELAANADAAQKRIEASFVLAEEKSERADEIADLADSTSEVASQMEDAKQEAIDASLNAQADLADVLVEQTEVIASLADTRLAFADVQLATADARTEVDSAQQYVVELMKPEPITNSPIYFDTGINYYSWKDNKGQSGHQFISPYNFYYANKKMEYGLSTAYVISKNNSPGNKGQLATFTDTALSATYTDDRGNNIFRYNLELSLPTGKTGLSGNQKNAVMDEDLVERNVFGEGMNATLGYSISHKIGKEDTWTAGLRYGLRGNYDLYDQHVSPGNFWNKNISWQHAGQQWRLTGSLNHQTYGGDTSLGAVDYRQGDELDANFVYDRDLAADKNLMFYYRYLNQQAASNGHDDFGGTQIGHYTGFSFKKSYNEKRAIRFTGDYMKKSGNIFDTRTGNTIDGRTKYTFGVGYDLALQNNRKLSVDLQRAFMYNQTPTAIDKVRYQGYNILLKYSGSL